ncbi:MAG TPA: hypothetical protein VH682_08050, partial [Gemmataceae bacterium]
RREAPNWDGLRAKAPQEDLVYVKEFLPEYNGGLVANGYHRYAPDLAGGSLAAGAEIYENLTVGTTPALHPQTADKPGVAVVLMSSPYVYLGGRVRVKALRKTEMDRVSLSLSTNGRTFQPLWQADMIGSSESVVDLGEKIERRYTYWLKIELSSTSPTGAGLDLLQIENDIQHAPRTLPWLGKGGNTITVAADSDTTLASRAFTCRITPDTHFQRNETSSSLGVQFDNLNVQDGACWWKKGIGTMTVPLDTPGHMTGLRFSTQVRARGAKDKIRLLVSFDDGKNWEEAAKIQGPTPGHTESGRFTRIPPGAKKALFRYELSGNNTIGILSFRIDADYKDPRAAKSFRPFHVVHRWKEKGEEKSHRATIEKLPSTYRIATGDVPEMVSVSYEMPVK